MKQRLSIPLAIKLVLMTAVAILGTAVPIAFKNSSGFMEVFGHNQFDTNSELAKSKANEVDSLVLKYLEKVSNVTNFIVQDFATEEQRRRALDLLVHRDPDLVNVDVYHMKEGQPRLYRRETNVTYLKLEGLESNYVDRLRQDNKIPVAWVFADKDKVHIRNTTLPGGAPLLTLGVPFPDDNGIVRHVAIADIRLDRLQKAFALGGMRVLYLVDDQGTVLAHSSHEEFVTQRKSLSDVEIVADLIAAHAERAKAEAAQRAAAAKAGARAADSAPPALPKQKERFYDPVDQAYVRGAYAQTAAGPMVIVQADEKVILEPAREAKLSAFELAGYVLSGALFLVMLFSFTLTSPLEDLHEATLQVAEGNFEAKAVVTTSDEVGELAEAFNQMVEGLKERDKAKNLLNKFHGSTVTNDLLNKGEVSLGGSKKHVTVFFSDIRGFTKFSEGHTPEEVVDMLNEYFQIMVGIITSNHGIVDKFVGDAIMAVWGAPTSQGNDRLNAVKASLEMRIALAELNEKRKARGETPIMIGMGIHSGPAISGTIGSTERMEYTVIGDTVNMASRIEASTKAFGADLLISETVAEEIGSLFQLEYAGAAEVKGKAEPIKMYKVRGFYEEDGTPVPVQTEYSDYEAGHVDKVKVAG